MSLEQTIGNLEIRYANVVTFVGSSNTMVDTTTGRIQTKGIQHNSNVITDVSGPHGRVAPTLKKYPEIAFESGKFDSNDSTNTYVQAGYTVTDSSHHNEYYGAWIFDDQTGFVTNKNLWISPINTYTTSGGAGTPTMTTSDAQCTTVSGVATPGEWVQLKLPNKVKLSSISIMGPTDGNQSSGDLGRSPKDAVLAGSVDGTTWNSVLTWSGVTDWALKTYKSFPANVDSTNYYNYFRLIVTKNDGTQVYASIQELQLYGYEENPPTGDHSVDTTFKSRFNNPQLTGVQVLVDGATGVGTNHISGGPDVTGTTTYNESGKHWELNGQLTSNITMEANTFLEGDQPHAVSVWFNSSNLEANVSNTCVFSIATEEKLDSVNLDLQSNTWHNLTYAYQGEGGSRVTYLDGRKVAEDQAEDTFGDYPPFAMTGYSQGGYVVSASSEYISGSDDRRSWKVFDGVRTAGSPPELWQTNGSTYTSTTPGVATGAGVQSFIANGVTFNGHWLKLKLPHKLLLNWLKVESGTNDERRPWKGAILGSNDDVNWYTLKSFDGDTASTALTWYNGGSSIDVSDIVINSQLAYNYILFVIEETKVGTGHNCLVINQMHLYGHRENDLVRLPDPTNVLKYPHIAMTGPAQRGYVATASAQETNCPPWEAFDESVATNTSGWIWNTGGTHNLGTESGSGTATDGGHWIRLELPHKLVVNRVDVISDAQNPQGRDEFPDEYAIYGWNGSGTWTKLLDVTGKNPTLGTSTTFSDTISNSTAYKHIALVVKSYYNNSSSYGRIAEIKYYGTGVDSIPIQIGGGNIDKVANFRVYDKFIGEDQVNEIWNAQKEEFGRAKPQMVLQQGKLGIGTDAPQGSLSVADEPHNLEEFPPRAMTANNTYFEGHGVFKASSSSEYSATYTAFDAFDKITYNDAGVADNAWLSANSSLYASASDYAFTGSATLGNGTVAGEWLKLELPYKIVLKSITLSPRPSSTTHLNQAPEDFKIYGSNDDINWTEVLSETGAAPAIWTGTDFITDTSSTTSYRYFAIVVQKTIGYAGFTAISGLKYFGTREQGQSVLHDGQLTLTKSLNVPRIGPALDADDTPRRDRLVVEYNTSTSQATGTDPTFGGVVRDTSGRGNDGVYYRRAAAANTTGGYNATEKAFEFSTQYTPEQHLRTRINNHSGDYIHSASIWFKTNKDTATISTNEETLFQIGNDFAAGVNIYASFYGDNLYYGWHTHNIYAATTEVNQLGWNHVCVTYTGGGSTTTSRKIYLNGKVQSATLSGTSGTLLNLPKDAFVTLGGKTRPTDTIDHLDGFLSNFKLYDTALTASEAKTLYDMGRCDEGHHTTRVSRSQLRMGGENLVIEPCIKGFYEEGTWVPYIAGSTSGVCSPSGSNYGWFIRVGNLVTIGGTVAWDGYSGAISGNRQIMGLPYAARNVSNARTAMSFGVTTSTGLYNGLSGGTAFRLIIDPGNNFIFLADSNETGGGWSTYSVSTTLVDSSGVIYGIGGTYRI
tara:strand:+ start:18629 stop:23119 length:4491 start_codon:yes stop_codon:yes gene_type:complete